MAAIDRVNHDGAIRSAAYETSIAITQQERTQNDYNHQKAVARDRVEERDTQLIQEIAH
ncbi:MAG: hypothetical protein HQK84_06915, partial [Nitrospinae bacterium]|nr:hypothetical protein [Nitrospinota bacterium]